MAGLGGAVGQVQTGSFGDDGAGGPQQYLVLMPLLSLCVLQVVTGRVARNKMYKRKIPKQQTAAAHAAVQSQAAALAAFEEPNSFVRPGYQAADQVGGSCVCVWCVGAQRGYGGRAMQRMASGVVC